MPISVTFLLLFPPPETSFFFFTLSPTLSVWLCLLSKIHPPGSPPWSLQTHFIKVSLWLLQSSTLIPAPWIFAQSPYLMLRGKLLENRTRLSPNSIAHGRQLVNMQEWMVPMGVPLCCSFVEVIQISFGEQRFQLLQSSVSSFPRLKVKLWKVTPIFDY